MRPRELTLVISHITSPAHPREKLPRCIKCQSLAEPLLELYWHIGDSTTRLGKVSPRSVMGEKRTLAIFRSFWVTGRVGRRWQYHEARAGATSATALRSRHAPNSEIDRWERPITADSRHRADAAYRVRMWRDCTIPPRPSERDWRRSHVTAPERLGGADRKQRHRNH